MQAIPSKILADMVNRFERVLKDPELELEARFVEDIDRQGFERVLRYMLSNKTREVQELDTLDVIQRLVRVSVASMPEIEALVQPGGKIGDLDPEAVVYVRKEQAFPRIEYKDYDVIFSVKRELRIDANPEMTSRFDEPYSKSVYRLKRRYSFTDDDGLFRYDLTVVKQGSGETPLCLSGLPETYEIEIEYLNSASGAPGELGAREKKGKTEKLAKEMFERVAEVLLLLRGSTTLLSKGETIKIQRNFAALVQTNRSISPKPVTLERRNLLPGTVDSFSVLDTPYTVTDKADGLRVFVYVDGDGRVYMLTGKMQIFPTDVRAPGLANSLFDGEYVTKSRTGDDISLALLFDVYFFKGADVRAHPLAVFGNVGGGSSGKKAKKKTSSGAEKATRAEMMTSAQSLLVAGGQLQIRAKKFRPLKDAMKIYEDYDKGVMEYPIDGLILTPAAFGVFQDYEGLPATKTSGSWHRVWKWKKPEENTIDFRVVYDRSSKGDIVVSNGFMNANLRVAVEVAESGVVDGYSVLTNTPIQHSFKERAFDPEQYGIGSPSTFRHSVSESRNLPLCTLPPREQVANNKIVEFSWDLSRKQWVPLRIRHDKMGPNTYETALSVWNSIAFPITIENLVEPSTVKDAGPGRDVYYAEDAVGSHTENMRSFHSHWIKNKILFASVARYLGAQTKEVSMLELACGKAGDLWKWIQNGFKVVVGVDVFEDNINNPRDGAYRRLHQAKQKSQLTPSHKYAFVPMDAGSPLGGADGIEAIQSPGLRKIAGALWKAGASDPKLKPYEGLATQEFDCVSCQFAVHYFFESPERLSAFLDNVASSLRVGGLFFGTCMDGETVDERLKTSPVLEAIHEDGVPIWRIEKDYVDPFDPKDPSKNYGRRIGVFMDSIGKNIVEYLVSFDLLEAGLKKRGLRLLTKAELKSAGLPASSAMFQDAYSSTPFQEIVDTSDDQNDVSKAKIAMKMGDKEKMFSFLNRWFVFKKEKAA